MTISRRWLYLLVPAALVAGVFAFGSARASGPFCHGPHGHHGASSSAEVAEHLEHKLEHLYGVVGASEAQEKQGDALAQRLAPSLFALMSEGRTLRSELKGALLAPKIDKARVEALRTRLDALLDRALDTGVDGMVSLAEILTPAQRQKLAERMERMHL